MKKSIIMVSAVLTSLSLTAFGVINWNNEEPVQEKISASEITSFNTNFINTIVKKTDPDFFYAVGTRFHGVKKGELDKANSILDFLPKEETQFVESYKSVSVIIIKNDKQTEIRELGKDDNLTNEQIKLLRSLGYSTNFLIRAEFKEKNKYTGKLQDNYFSPHLTIVPEKQAVYAGGKEALLAYLRKNNKKNTINLEKRKLQPAKLYFTVTKEGNISKIRLDRTSGYDSIDNTMLKLINNTLGKWDPAENIKGEKVEQELVISFGMVGC